MQVNSYHEPHANPLPCLRVSLDPALIYRLATTVGPMQPLSALQQLTKLSFTRCEYGTAAQLPAVAIAALTRLVALHASGCTTVNAAGASCRLRTAHVQVSNPTTVPRPLYECSS